MTMTASVVRAEPQAGDIIIRQERGASAGPCSVGAFQRIASTPAASYADALRQADALGLLHHVDVWATYRARWADPVPPTFRRVARHRQPPHSR